MATMTAVSALATEKQPVDVTGKAKEYDSDYYMQKLISSISINGKSIKKYMTDENYNALLQNEIWVGGSEVYFVDKNTTVNINWDKEMLANEACGKMGVAGYQISKSDTGFQVSRSGVGGGEVYEGDLPYVTTFAMKDFLSGENNVWNLSIGYGSYYGYGTYNKTMIFVLEENAAIFEYQPDTSLHTHNYNETVVSEPEGCEKGENRYACICGLSYTKYIPAPLDHTWGPWETIIKATTTSEGKRIRECTECYEEETEIIPRLSITEPKPPVTTEPIPPVTSEITPPQSITGKVSVTASNFRMKTGQKTTACRVTDIAKGDAVSTVKSSNAKIVKVSNIKKSGTFKLTAGKKTGTAKITITMKSGLKKILTVKVRKKAVTTTKVSAKSKKIILKKGSKADLGIKVTPITSQQKLRYTSSDTKVAKVTSKGVVKAIKKGKAKITAKSGKKKAVVSITVR